MNVHWLYRHARYALAATAAVLTIGSATRSARADYPDEVRQDHPLAYWRFEDAAAVDSAPAG